MASEITLSAAIAYLDSVGVKDGLSIANLIVSVATKKIIHQAISVAITDTVITLGGVTSPGYSMFVNRDPTNIINLKVASGSTIFATMNPGEFALLRLGSGAQVPNAIALVAPCVMDYLLCMT